MMARRCLAVAALVAAFFGFAGASVAVSAPEPAKVMFIGDSITGSPGCWRAPLWVALTDVGYRVDMVGPRTENECGDIANKLGESWDPDNMGIGNITTIKMWVKLAKDNVLSEHDPNVVVQLLGTNDLLGGGSVEAILEQYDKLLELYREQNPTMRVVVGTPPPIDPGRCGGCEAVQAELAAALPAWASSVTTPASPVYVADLTTGFDVATLTDDGIHPNQAGNAFLATAWEPTIVRALADRPAPASAQPSPETRSEPADARPAIAIAAAVVLAGIGVGAYVARRRRS